MAAELDLSGLERVAERMGLGALAARVVPRDRRGGRWYLWRDGRLDVSELVLERLAPREAAALLTHTVLEAAELGAWRRCALVRGGLLLLLLALAWFGFAPGRTAGAVALALSLLALGAWLVAARTAALQRADDLAVERLGDPELLVRALNTIHQDELHLGRLHLRARPDIHARAERLVRLHRLRQGGCRRNGQGDGHQDAQADEHNDAGAPEVGATGRE